MPFLGTLVNFFVVLACGIAGTFIKRGVPKRISDAIMSAMAICVIYIGVCGTLDPIGKVGDGEFLSEGLVKVLLMIVSMALGTLLGEIINIDSLIHKLGLVLEKRFFAGGAEGSFSRGFVSASILFCVGAMTVTGAFEDAMGRPDTLIAKSVIDGISCLIMSSTMGIGCAFSAIFVLVYQGALTLLGIFLVDALPAVTVMAMSAVGSLVVILVGTNVLGITKIKTANMIPAIFMPIVLVPLLELII